MLILASSSPRRRELLPLITDDFTVIPSDADERSDITDPGKLVMELAFRKAADVYSGHPADTVIGADTVVYINGSILGKPADMADAEKMIKMLSGNTHTVFTGLCVMGPGGVKTDFCSTRVTFARMSDGDISNYLASENVLDKAGAYAAQGKAAQFIERIDGCFFNVVGLPVHLLYTMLNS